MATADLCAAFGVGQSTAAAKAKVIRDALHANRMDPAWMLASFVDRNPLAWMAEVNGPGCIPCHRSAEAVVQCQSALHPTQGFAAGREH